MLFPENKRSGGFMRYAVLLTTIFVIIGGPHSADSAEPMDDLKAPVEQIISLLKDPKYSDPAMKEQQRAEIMSIVKNVFNFYEISKRALGRNWNKLSIQQRQVFEETFADFLGFTYFKKIRDSYQGESVIFLSQEKISDEKALVKTKIPRKNNEIPLDYRMFSKNGKWYVYDVLIEGVSLVTNYRTQFEKILGKESPDQLIERLRKKIVEQREQDKTTS
jgi:phospholipid transport system substrate-binding protein